MDFLKKLHSRLLIIQGMSSFVKADGVWGGSKISAAKLFFFFLAIFGSVNINLLSHFLNNTFNLHFYL